MDEIDTQCILSISAFEEMTILLSDQETIQSKEVWKYLRAFLSHSGILGSFILKKGNPEKTLIVTDYLKKELNIKENSPIKDKGGRNFLEHIEVFEYYAANSKNKKGIIQTVFKNRTSFNYLSSERYYYKRVLILDEMIFAYQKQELIKELSLNELFAEVKRILGASETAKSRLNIIEY
ncbi:MAG: hypothetical protein WBA74_21305 [Cyclobacteriaceae bacterium]